MTNIRPFQIVFMAVFGLLALVGLYVFSTYKGAGDVTPAGSVEIWGPFPKDSMDGAVNAIKAANTGFNGVSYTYVRPETFSQDLANALAAGAGPDLVIISQEQLMAERPKLEVIPFSSLPLDTYRKNFASEFELYLTGSGTYGIPLLIDPLVLYYNRASLASAGIALPPASWEAVSGIVSKLSQKGQGETLTRYAIPLGGYANVSNARALISALFLQSGTTITEQHQEGIRSSLGSGSGSVTGTNPAVSALSFYSQFADPVKSLYTWNGSLPLSRQAFLSGDLALYPGYASEARALRAANPNLDFDMAPLPQPATAPNRATYGLAYAFAIPKVADNKSGAYSAALALSTASITTLLTEETGMAPALRSALANPPAGLYASVVYPEALIAKGWLSPAPGAVDGVFAGMIQSVISGRSSVSEALSGTAQSLDALLR